MKIFFTFFFLVFFHLLSAQLVHAQQVFKLNSIQNQSKQKTAKTITGAPHLRQYYTLNNDSFDFSEIKSGDYIEVAVAAGSTSTFLVNRVENYTSTTTSFIARDIEEPENTFTFTYTDGQLHGIFHKSHEDIYFFEYDGEINQNYVATSSSFYDDQQFCSIHEVDHSSPSLKGARFLGKSSGADVIQPHTPSTAAMAGTLSDDITIDVMILYTPNSKTWAESTDRTIDLLISEAMAKSQTVLDNSETHITLRLVHYYQTDYDGDSLESLSSSDDNYVSAGDHLRRLTRNPDNRFDLCSESNCEESDYDGYMVEAHQLRDQYGADVVAAILSEPNTGGIAWVNNSTSGSSQLAFSINRVQQIASNYTLVHEIGHNMGNAHARNQSDAAAGEFGGLFSYSTGNRFPASGNTYATVMAYGDALFQPIPYFSNPDVQFSGKPTGNPLITSNDAGPADNARSMREIKHVIASYRTTVVNPPSISVGESSISAELNQENSAITVPITLQNNGTSDLMYNIDFDIQSNVISASKQQADQMPAMDAAAVTASFSSVSSLSFTESGEPGVIYSADFEESEGFTTGDFPAEVGWRSFSVSTPFEISSENPSNGSLHLRLPRRTDSSTAMFSRSPFFGPQPMGEYSVSFDIATQDQIIGGEGETFDVYAFDGSNGAISSGLIISGGNIFARNVTEQGSETFSSTSTSFPTNGTYRTIEIKYNPNNRSVDYYLEGDMIASNPYPSGRKPDYMYFGQRNKVSGVYMDVDNIRVERVHSPFNWLKTESFGGVIAAGESQSVNLTLNAVDVPTGTYETVLQVRSNDPANPVIEVPISATIEMATSSEVSQEAPQRLELSQNYPNPFNPTTTIQFTLDQSSDITLEVFNITGQRVATLINGSLSAGSHQHTFDASSLSSGIYMYRLRTPDQMLTRQMILIK
ncbi:zinc-dependent metalloprotease [Rhodohalobacter sp. 8-1]|uniref:zinc-dependent metalloprotease n=1 Tax=Rhodohalobacter sp. 8-1 TaxID=3131972 RepID=UPI0030EDEFEC